MKTLRRMWADRRTVPVLARLAVAIWVVYGALHVMGLRDWVSVLSGTPVNAMPFELVAPAGMLYVVAHFGAVLVAPILCVAAALGELLGIALQRWAERSTHTSHGAPESNASSPSASR